MKSSNRFSFALVAAIALCASSFSFAKDNNGGGKPDTGSSTAYGGSGYSAAGAAALSGSVSSAGANSHSSNYSAQDVDLSGAGSSQDRSYFLSLPQPVVTINPANSNSCIVNESSAFALGWNFVSGSGSKQVPEKICYVLRMAENAERTCQFAAADFLNQVAFNEMFPSRAALPASGRQNQIACLK